MTSAPFYDLARKLIYQRVDRGDFTGYADHELDGKVDELADEFLNAWHDALEDMRRNEPTPEDRKAENAQQRDLAA